jgi:hypothetical protein
MRWETAKVFRTENTGHRVVGAADFSMGGIEILQSKDGRLSGSMKADQ